MKENQALGKLFHRVLIRMLCLLLVVGMLPLAVFAESNAKTPTADRFALTYEEVDINLDSVYDLPLYLTTGYYTEPSASGKITWDSSEKTVATVSPDGHVHALSAGQTTITATHADFPGKSATCKVNVYKNQSCTTFYYVSPNGSDTNPGTEASPFKTIQKARDTIRTLKTLPQGGVTVILEDGKYYQSETILFTPEDSGTKENPIVYKARNKGKATITGEVPITGWKKAENVEGMAPSANGNVYVADITPGWRFHDLYLNGERQQISRSFNTDNWRDFPKIDDNGAISFDAEKGCKVIFRPGELDGLEGNTDIEVSLQPVLYWNLIPALVNVDPASRTGYLQSKMPCTASWAKTSFRNQGWYNILNALKYLDEPGEWCVDSKAGKVYYWPRNAETLNTDEILAAKPYELVRMQGDGVEKNFQNTVKHITFDGINFTYTDRMPENDYPDDWVLRQAENPDAAVYLEGTYGCRIANAELAHLGSYGIAAQRYAQRNEFLHNRIHDVGSGGIELYGYGVGTVDVNHHNIVMYNAIQDMGKAPYQHSPAVSVFGSGYNAIAYNYIAGAPYAGISIVGTDENSVSYTNPNTRSHMNLFGKVGNQYQIRFEDLKAIPESEYDGNKEKGEYFSIGTLAEKYQHSDCNVAEYNILEDYSQGMDDGGALYAWYCGVGNVYAYNILKEQLTGYRKWVFTLYMDDRAIGVTLSDNLCSGTFTDTIDKSFAPYKNRWINNDIKKFPEKPANFDTARNAVLKELDERVGGFPMGESITPAILAPTEGSTVKIPTTFILEHSDNASAYTVEIATDKEFTDVVHTLSTRSSVVTTDVLEYDTQYYARVTTREYLGEPKVSAPISFRTDKQSKPGPLNGTRVSNDIDAVLVQWEPKAKTQVNVYRKAEGETDFTLIASNLSSKGYLDSSVKEKKTYTYKVAPVNKAGEGPMSEEMTITTRELNVLFSDNFDNGKISDLWTNNKGEKINSIHGYNVVVENGQWKPTPLVFNLVPDSSYYVGLNKDWADYAVEMDIQFNGFAPGHKRSYTGFGPFARANTPEGTTNKQFYQLIYRSKTGNLELVSCDNGSNWTEYAKIPTGELAQEGKWYSMRLEAVGKRLRMYLDGVLVGEFENDKYATGGIGFSFIEEVMAVDNVRVSQPKQYAITADDAIANGTVTASSDKAAQGCIVNLTAAPAEGYQLKHFTLDGVPLKGESFVMPGKDVVVSAVFEKPVVKNDLEKRYNELKDLTNDHYSQETWDAFTAALKNAKDVLENKAADQATVNAALKTLNETYEKLTKNHIFTHVEAKEATCTETGNKEYWTCSGCGKLFADENGTVETTLEEVTIQAIGHKLTKVDAKKATCTEAGNMEYWTCANCGKLFADEDGKTETTLEKVTIPATGHSFGEWTQTKAPTCTEAGEEIRTCGCGTTETHAIPALGHKLTKVDAKKATCTEAGNMEYWTCANCGKLFADEFDMAETTLEEVTIPATGHSFGEWTQTKAPTCTEAGEETGTCGCGMTETRVIPALGHKLTKVDAKDATTTSEGNIEHYICSDCGKYFSDAEGKNEIDKDSVVIDKVTPKPDPNGPVQTGDNFNVMWVGTIMVLALAGAATLAVVSLKKKYN